MLTVITGMIDLLAQAVADEPQLAGAARLIDEAATRGAVLTARLLAFARGKPAEPREVDVALLLDEAVCVCCVRRLTGSKSPSRRHPARRRRWPIQVS